MHVRPCDEQNRRRSVNAAAGDTPVDGNSTAPGVQYGHFGPVMLE
jgi:hypothetical protein